MEVETGNEPQNARPERDYNKRKTEGKRRGSMTGGLILIAIGIFFLLEKYIPQINFRDVWPVILIVIGLSLLFNAFRDKNYR